MPFLLENDVVKLPDLLDGFPGRSVWTGESWKRYGMDEGSEALIPAGVEDGFHGSGTYAPKVISSPSSDGDDPNSGDSGVETPWSSNKEGACQVITWCSKEVKDSPCADVENTGCKCDPFRKRF
jgi:hypothetical protein